MLSLSQSVGYAIKALACMEQETCESKFVHDIAKYAGVPEAYLSKLFTKMVAAGILESKRGWKGGTSLARPAAEISLLEVAQVIDGEGWIGDCLLGYDCGGLDECPTLEFWRAERKRIEKELGKITVADIAEFERQRQFSVRCKSSSEPEIPETRSTKAIGQPPNRPRPPSPEIPAPYLEDLSAGSSTWLDLRLHLVDDPRT